MKIIQKLKRVQLAMRAARETMKFGGINTIQVSQIENTELLKNKKIIVTGAGSGIGFAIAQKCVHCGAQVVITGRNQEKIIEAVQKIGSAACKGVVWDITQISEAEKKLQECLDDLGGDVDILVNNAGVQPSEFFPNVTEREWDRIYDINSKGTFFTTETFCRYCFSHPRQQGYRKILNIDSQGGFVGATYPYRMSKWDIRGYTKGLGLAMAPHHVLVNSIAPGVIKTEMQKFSMQQKENTFCGQNPLGRVALPEEIAELAAFILSDGCNYMVGQNLLVDGGFCLK